MARLSIRIDLDADRQQRLGPGKIMLMEQIAATGSISAAGRVMAMSYRRAWELVEELNGFFDTPLVISKSGGRKGGGAELTRFGKEVLLSYRKMNARAEHAANKHLSFLAAHRRDRRKAKKT